jgi:uncharacterized protein YkwD
MGIEDRDRYRAQARRPSAARAPRASLIVAAVVALLAVALSPAGRTYLGVAIPFGLEEAASGELHLQPFPGGVDMTAPEPLYAPGDAWLPWLAGEATCPGGENANAPAVVQNSTMLCLVNFARRREGLHPLIASTLLDKAAAAKAADIVRCGKFEHEACGRPVNQAAMDLGYHGLFGENLYVAGGRRIVPRAALDGWLNSDGHRRNLFEPRWRTLGIARLADADVERIRDGVIWVNQFGA